MTLPSISSCSFPSWMRRSTRCVPAASRIELPALMCTLLLARPCSGCDAVLMELLERGRALRHAPRPRKRVRHRDRLLLPRESAPQAARRHLVRPAQLQGGVRGDAARRRGRKRALRLRRARRELALHARWQAALWCGSSELVPLLCLCLAHRRALEPHGHHGQALPRLPSRDGGRARLQRAPAWTLPRPLLEPS